MYDAIVIGGGSAGLAATTWLARYRRRVLLVDAGEPRNRWVEEAHGYLGSDPIDPATLLERAHRDLDAYTTVDRVQGKASSAATEPRGGFAVEADGRCHLGRRLVLATGVADAFPDVDGFFTHYGADVFHCPSCDGYQAQDLPVVAIGWSPAMAGFALELLDWASSVTVVTDGQDFEGNGAEREALSRHGIDIVEDKASALLGERGHLQAVQLRSGGRLFCRLAFFSIAHQPVNGLAEGLGCALDDHGHVSVDDQAQTTVPGVYAAGDLTPGMQLIQVAAAKGAVAGTCCALSLRGELGAPDAPVPGPSVERELHG